MRRVQLSKSFVVATTAAAAATTGATNATISSGSGGAPSTATVTQQQRRSFASTNAVRSIGNNNIKGEGNAEAKSAAGGGARNEGDEEAPFFDVLESMNAFGAAEAQRNNTINTKQQNNNTNNNNTHSTGRSRSDDTINNTEATNATATPSSAPSNAGPTSSPPHSSSPNNQNSNSSTRAANRRRNADTTQPLPSYLKGTTRRRGGGATVVVSKPREELVTMSVGERYTFLSAFLAGDVVGTPATSATTAVLHSAAAAATATVNSSSSDDGTATAAAAPTTNSGSVSVVDALPSRVVSPSTGASVHQVAGKALATERSFGVFASCTAARVSLTMARDGVVGVVSPSSASSSPSSFVPAGGGLSSIIDGLTWPTLALSATPAASGGGGSGSTFAAVDGSGASSLLSGSGGQSSLEADTAHIRGLLIRDRRLNNTINNNSKNNNGNNNANGSGAAANTDASSGVEGVPKRKHRRGVINSGQRRALLKKLEQFIETDVTAVNNGNSSNTSATTTVASSSSSNAEPMPSPQSAEANTNTNANGADDDDATAQKKKKHLAVRKRLASKLGLDEEAADASLLAISGPSVASVAGNDVVAVGGGSSSAAPPSATPPPLTFSQKMHLKQRFNDEHRRLRRVLFRDVLPTLLLDATSRNPWDTVPMEVSVAAVSSNAGEGGASSSAVANKTTTINVTALQHLFVDLNAMLSNLEAHVGLAPMMKSATITTNDGGAPPPSAGVSPSPAAAFLSSQWRVALAMLRAQLGAAVLNAAVSQAAAALVATSTNAVGGVPQHGNSGWWTDGGQTVNLKRAVFTLNLALGQAEGLLKNSIDPIISEALAKALRSHQQQQTGGNDATTTGDANAAAAATAPTATAGHANVDAAGAQQSSSSSDCGDGDVLGGAHLLRLALLSRVDASRQVLRLQSMIAALPSPHARRYILDELNLLHHQQQQQQCPLTPTSPSVVVSSAVNSSSSLLSRDMIKEMFLIAEAVALLPPNDSNANGNEAAAAAAHLLLPSLIPTTSDVSQQVASGVGSSASCLFLPSLSSFSPSSSSVASALSLFDVRDTAEALLLSMAARRSRWATSSVDAVVGVADGRSGQGNSSRGMGLGGDVRNQPHAGAAAAALFGSVANELIEKILFTASATITPTPAANLSEGKSADKDHHHRQSSSFSSSLISSLYRDSAAKSLSSTSSPSSFAWLQERFQSSGRRQPPSSSSSSASLLEAVIPTPSELADSLMNYNTIFGVQSTHSIGGNADADDGDAAGSSSSSLSLLSSSSSSHHHRSLATFLVLIRNAHGDVKALRQLHQAFASLVTSSLFGRGGVASSGGSGGGGITSPSFLVVDAAQTPEAIATVTYALLKALSSCCTANPLPTVALPAVPMGAVAANANGNDAAAVPVPVFLTTTTTSADGTTADAAAPIPTPTTAHHSSNLPTPTNHSSSSSPAHYQQHQYPVQSMASLLKPNDLLQWAKDAYDDYVSWTPQSHWRHPLVLQGLLDCSAAAADCWKSQVLFQQLLMQAKIGGGGAEGSAGGDEKGGGHHTDGGAAAVGLGMARTSNGSGKSRRGRIAGEVAAVGGRGERSANATVQRRDSFDVKARNERFASARSNVAFGVRNYSGGARRRGGSSSRFSTTFNALGMRVAGAVSPCLMNNFLLSFRDPFQSFYAMQAHFLFNVRPSGDTVHQLMARLLLDHLAVREDNTLVTRPNTNYLKRVEHEALEAVAAAAGEDSAAASAAPRVAMFANLAEQRRGIAEMERAEEDEALQLLIAAVDSSIPNANPLLATSAAVDTNKYNTLRDAIAHRREYLYERQGHASDLLFSTFYLLQKGNKGALSAGRALGSSKKNESSSASSSSSSPSTENLLKPSLRYFAEGPTPDGLTVSLALAQVFKNYVADVEAVMSETASAAAGAADPTATPADHPVDSQLLINKALLLSSAVAVAGGGPNSSSSAATPTNPLASYLFGTATPLQRKSASSSLIALEALPTLSIIIALAEEAIDASLRLLLDGYYPIWCLMGGATSPHVLGKRLRRRAAFAVEENAAMAEERSRKEVAFREAAANKTAEEAARRRERRSGGGNNSGSSSISSVLSSAASPSTTTSAPLLLSTVEALIPTNTVNAHAHADGGATMATMGREGEHSSTHSHAKSIGSSSAGGTGAALAPLHGLGLAVLTQLLAHYESLLVLRDGPLLNAVDDVANISSDAERDGVNVVSGVPKDTPLFTPSSLLPPPPMESYCDAARTLLDVLTAMATTPEALAAVGARGSSSSSSSPDVVGDETQSLSRSPLLRRNYAGAAETFNAFFVPSSSLSPSAVKKVGTTQSALASSSHHSTTATPLFDFTSPLLTGGITTALGGAEASDDATAHRHRRPAAHTAVEALAELFLLRGVRGHVTTASSPSSVVVGGGGGGGGDAFGVVNPLLSFGRPLAQVPTNAPPSTLLTAVEKALRTSDIVFGSGEGIVGGGRNGTARHLDGTTLNASSPSSSSLKQQQYNTQILNSTNTGPADNYFVFGNHHTAKGMAGVKRSIITVEGGL